jgi:hypothetical protein
MASTTKFPSTVQEVLNTLGMEIAIAGAREISCHCPFHTDRHPSFSINAESGLWVCFQCGERGSLEQLISRVGKGAEPVAYLRELRQSNVGKYKPKALVEEVDEEPIAAMIYAKYESFKLPPTWAYEDRFMTLECVERFGLKWNKGWVIPLWAPELRGNPTDLWGWQFKRLDFVQNYPAGIHKAQTLFGLRECKSDCTFLVESPLDVVRLASFGFEGGLASFGAMVSQAQLQILLERSERVIVALDNDLEGRRQGKKVYRWLSRFLPAEMLKYHSDVKDVGEMPDDELAEVLNDL